MAGTRVLLLLVLAVVPAFAANFDISWSNGADYSSWASGKDIKVGDTVTFQYVGGLHSVDEVNQADYAACSTSNTLSSDGTGSTVITLTQAGTRYFVCSTSGHCGQGMKVAIPVSAATSGGSTPGGSTPSTPGGSTPTTSSPGTPSTPRTSQNSPSAAAGFEPGKASLVVGAFLAGGLALLG